MRSKEIIQNLPKITVKAAATYGTTPDDAKSFHSQRGPTISYSEHTTIDDIASKNSLQAIGALAKVADNPNQIQWGEKHRTAANTKSLASRLVFDTARHPRNQEHIAAAEQLLPFVGGIRRPFAKRRLNKAAGNFSE